MPYRKIFVLIFAVAYITIARDYSASKWTDSSNDHENLHLILFTLVVLTALVAVYLINKNQLVQCFLVSGTALSLIYAGVAVLSEDYSGLILPAVAAVMFLLFPQARKWIETSSESSKS